jgi:Protein of unknown function (DUF998)
MTAITTAPACDRATSITRSLLGYGVIAGPVYVAVSLAQALTRDGFDLARHPWSLLSNGTYGWIQITNFLLTGAMVVAFAFGLRRALGTGRGATWAPRLVGGYGVGLICAGIFRADPALGFPAGTPDGPGQVSWHGTLHLALGGVGFACLIAACFVIAGRFAAEERPGWAAYSRVTGVLFLGGFVGIASGSASAATTLAFVAAVLVAWAWMTALAIHLYRHAAVHTSS